MIDITKDTKLVIGQEAICPRGLGRITEFQLNNFPHNYVRVSTYIKDYNSKYDPCNVKIFLEYN